MIGFTATPWRMSNKGFTNVFQDLILGKTVRWLIDNNRLAPFKYYSVNLMDSDILTHNSTGDFSNDSITKAMQKTIYGDVIKHYKKFAESKNDCLHT